MKTLPAWVAPLGCAALSAVLAPTVAIATPATAHATPPIGISAVTLSKQTVNGKD